MVLMMKWLILGIFLFLIFMPFVFKEYIFAIKSTSSNEPTSGLKSESPNITNIQTFQPDTEPPYIKITSPNHCPPSFVNGTVMIQGVSNDSDRVKMVEVFSHTIPLEEDFHFDSVSV